ncbi:MAG: Na(+)/H(+) antiporter [Ktedonobacterales bacterium]|jgi:cell volume regulation protein A|nr:MAG: Na(+)/H(+) antiporter [Ktedonobacterales bacterium]
MVRIEGISIEHVLLIGSALLLLGVLAARASSRVSIPPLLLFLVLGMLAGSDGPGGIFFNDVWLSQLVGTIGLALIIFSGGLDTNWTQIRPVLWRGLSLSTLGVLLSAGVVAGFAVLALGFTWTQGMLLGAIVSATDAAAVFSIVGKGATRLKQQTVSLLEMESGANDPMAVFLTLGMVELLAEPHTSPLSLIPQFLLQMAVGGAVGYGVGRLFVLVVNRWKPQASGLYLVLTTAVAIFTYSSAASLHGSGFLAVYIAGLVIGNGRVAELDNVERFHDGLATLMECAMFLTLGLLVYPSHLVSIIGIGLLTTLALTFVARPVSVFLSLLLARMPAREKLFVSWAGLRGAVPIILATFPLLERIPQAELIFDLVFFTVLVSVLLQGTTIPWVGRWLRLTSS